jgi:hypothetical protein
LLVAIHDAIAANFICQYQSVDLSEDTAMITEVSTIKPSLSPCLLENRTLRFSLFGQGQTKPMNGLIGGFIGKGSSN